MKAAKEIDGAYVNTGKCVEHGRPGAREGVGEFDIRVQGFFTVVKRVRVVGCHAERAAARRASWGWPRGGADF